MRALGFASLALLFACNDGFGSSSTSATGAGGATSASGSGAGAGAQGSGGSGDGGATTGAGGAGGRGPAACKNGSTEPGELCLSEPVQLAEAGSDEQDLVLFDCDGDGDLDAATVDPGQEDALLIRVNNGAGLLTGLVTIVTPEASPGRLAVGNLDGAGALDLAVAHGGGGNGVSRWHAVGECSFAKADFIDLGAETSDVLLVDLDGDAIDDVVAVTNTTGSDTLHVRYSEGGSPADFTIPANGTHALTAGDLSDDGVADDVAYVGQTQDRGYWHVGDGSILTTGSLELPSTTMLASSPQGLAIGDMDGDGHDDVVTTSNNEHVTQVSLWDGAAFTLQPDVDPGGEAPRGVALGDMDGDGHLDAVTANSGTNDVSVLLNTGNGVLDLPAMASPTVATPFPVAVLTNPTMVAVGDLNGDGALDIVVVSTGAGAKSRVSVMLSQP